MKDQKELMMIETIGRFRLSVCAFVYVDQDLNDLRDQFTRTR